MGDRSAIEWTDATWNPVRGCSRVSEGCRHCYAERVAARFSGPGLPYEGLATTRAGEPRWTGEVRVVEEHLEDPLHWRRPRRIFVNSMSDLFHERLADADILRVFEVMARAPQHIFQILTKRPVRMRDFSLGVLAPWRDRPLPHIWIGVSVEHQAAADERIPVLLETPASRRFISAEPLIGPVDLRRWVFRDVDALGGLDWVIVGGESGPGARPMHPEWPREIRYHCAAAGIPFFFKQWGEHEPVGQAYGQEDLLEEAQQSRGELVAVDRRGNVWDCDRMQPPSGTWFMERVGKKRAGRLLDGRVWDEMPEAR